MNFFEFGFDNNLEKHFPKFRKTGFFYTADTTPALPRSKTFDVTLHSINPFREMTYEGASDFIDMLDTLFPRGGATLTKDDGLEFIADQLDAAMNGPKGQKKKNPLYLNTLISEPDPQSPPGHQWAYKRIRRILRSPVLKRVLCNPGHNKFQLNGVVLAPLDRAKLTAFDVRILSYSLIGQYRGQVILDDLNFHAHDMLVRLVRENRLMARVTSLAPLERKAPELHDAVLSVFATMPKDDQLEAVRGALYRDAVVLAEHAGLRPDVLREDNDFNNFLRDAMIV